MSRKRKPATVIAPIVETVGIDALSELTLNANTEFNTVPVPSQEEIENAVEEVFEDHKDKLSLPFTSEAGMKMFDEALKTQIANKVAEVKLDIRSHYSTLTEFLQARSCQEGKELNFIPLDYVKMNEGTNIISSIDFAFIIPFAQVKGDVDYCTVDENEITLIEGMKTMPSRYNLINHEVTTEVKFCKDGKYDVKSIFDESLSFIRSSLFSNQEIAK